MSCGIGALHSNESTIIFELDCHVLTEIFVGLQCFLLVWIYLLGNCSIYRTLPKNIMVSASTKKGCYISILNIIQGDVEATQVR